MASLDDILTTQKNGVVAINGYTTALLRDQGTFTSATVTADTLVIAGRGYLVSWSILVAGSTSGTIHNFNAVTGYSAANALCKTGTAVGIFPAKLVFTSGLVIVPGTGQSLNVTYFLG
jgi:hypothetical protein